MAAGQQEAWIGGTLFRWAAGGCVAADRDGGRCGADFLRFGPLVAEDGRVVVAHDDWVRTVSQRCRLHAHTEPAFPVEIAVVDSEPTPPAAERLASDLWVLHHALAAAAVAPRVDSRTAFRLLSIPGVAACVASMPYGDNSVRALAALSAR